jgi:hypothetical protein
MNYGIEMIIQYALHCFVAIAVSATTTSTTGPTSSTQGAAQESPGSQPNGGHNAEKLDHPKEGFPWEMITALGTAALALVTVFLATDARKGMHEQIQQQKAAQERQFTEQQRIQLDQFKEQRRILDEQFQEQRMAHSLDIMLKLSDRWDSEKMRQARKESAAKHLSGRSAPSANDPSQPILWFFETLGMIAKYAHIDPYMIWCEFGYVVCLYYSAFKSGISNLQKETGDSSFYEQFVWLNSQMLELECKSRNIDAAAAEPNAAALKSFLESETSLLVSQNTIAAPMSPAPGGGRRAFRGSRYAAWRRRQLL